MISAAVAVRTMRSRSSVPSATSLSAGVQAVTASSRPIRAVHCHAARIVRTVFMDGLRAAVSLIVLVGLIQDPGHEINRRSKVNTNHKKMNALSLNRAKKLTNRAGRSTGPAAPLLPLPGQGILPCETGGLSEIGRAHV